MSLRERPTHWLPQNPLSFIINQPLLITQVLLHTMHVLYMTARKREETETAVGGEVERKSEAERRENGWNHERQTKGRYGIRGGDISAVGKKKRGGI